MTVENDTVIEVKKINVDDLLGWKSIKTWLEPRGKQLVGMCRVVSYDRNGNIKDIKVEETGIVGVYK